MPIRVSQNASLQALNTFGVRARAARLVDVQDPAELPAAVALARQRPPVLVLGAGSNLLFTRDHEGTVLHLRTRGRRELASTGSEVVVEGEAGEDWDDFVRWTLSRGLFGLENLSRIPGSVGASPIQNIGAYGVEMRERFAGLTAIDLSDGQEREFAEADCGFGYRDSVFRRAAPGRWLVTRVRFRLSREPRPRLDYGELRAELAARGCVAPSPQDVADAVSAIRARKLPDPAVLGNAGSFFKNPVVPEQLARALQAREPQLAWWPDPAGAKLSAAWLIERCGWKGVREGDAGVHASHALVLVNYGDASGAQILALAQRIRASVLERFGVALESEPVIV